MAKKEAVEIVVIMDRSGSMSSIANEAVGGYTNFIEGQRAVPGAANVTLVLFDDRYDVVYDAVKLTKTRPPALTMNRYAPLGMTAMNDAIGRAITALEAKNPAKAIICIMTDGHENASREYTKATTAAKIKAAEDRGWEIVFLAANIDVQQASQNLGITRGISKGFTADVAGTTMAFASMSASASAYRTA
jgi:uncharacterized protein YegL